jgi:hypothetical protein
MAANPERSNHPDPSQDQPLPNVQETLRLAQLFGNGDLGGGAVLPSVSAVNGDLASLNRAIADPPFRTPDRRSGALL